MSLMSETPVASFQLPKLASTERRAIEGRDRCVVNPSRSETGVDFRPVTSFQGDG